MLLQINKIALVLIMSSLFAYSCNKGEDECLDCIYEVFECKVNEEGWGPDCDSGTILWGCSAIDCQYYSDTKALSIRVVSESKNERFLFSSRLLELGRNPISNSRSQFLDYDLPGNCGRYDMDTLLENYINLISLDTVNFIVEGEFGFTAHDPCGNSIEVTEGKFLLGYRF